MFAVQGLSETEMISLNKVVFHQLSTLTLNLDKFLGPTRSFARVLRLNYTLSSEPPPGVLLPFYPSLADFKLEQRANPSPQFSLACVCNFWILFCLHKKVIICLLTATTHQQGQCHMWSNKKSSTPFLSIPWLTAPAIPLLVKAVASTVQRITFSAKCCISYPIK